MTVKALIDLIKADGGSWLILIVVVLSIVQITPIKVDPWTVIFKWLGKQFNSDTLQRIEVIEAKLDTHIRESELRDIRERRTTILDFANSCMNNRKHTKEEFDFIIAECDKYEAYCRDNGIQNGVAEAGIREIKNVYAECIHTNSFLQGGGGL